MEAVVLAGGYATRLWPLTRNRPKMLLPVGKTTVIDRILAELERDDRITEVYLSTNQRFVADFKRHFKGREYEKPKLSVEETTDEDEKFGVVGALAQLIEREGLAGEDLLVVAGDNLISFDLSEFIDFFEARNGSALAAYDVGSITRASSYGILELDGERVVDFQEKPDDPPSTLVSIACYAFRSEDVEFERYLAGGNNPDEPGWFIEWLQKRKQVDAFTFDGAFHGRTLGALSLNRSKATHRRGFPEVPGIICVPFPSSQEAYEQRWLTDGPGGNVVADTLHPERGVIDPDEVAFLILEPIQGEGGYRVAHPEFARDLEALRERYDLNIVADEIQSGLGRTGELWAVDHLDLTPDVITAGKGLRVGATISRSDLFPEETGRLSSTWGAGDIVASLQGVLTIDVIHEQNLLANVRERGEQLRTRLEDAIADGELPGVVDVRGKGLMLAVEFDTKERREAVLTSAFERGLLTLGCGYKTLRLLPPLDVTPREIDLGVALLLEAVADVEPPVN